MLYLVERFQNSNHMGSPKGPHFAVASPNTATDQNHGIDRLDWSAFGRPPLVRKD
jgi:hypothetical protein